MKKNILVTLTILSVVSGGVAFGLIANADSNCGGWFEPSCTINTNNVNTFVQEQLKTENNQRGLDKAQPLPVITHSLERDNIIKRLQDFNKPDKISYIYLVSFGKVMAFYTIKGKVSSVNSYLADPTQLIDRHGNPCDNSDNYTNNDCFQVESPDLDGSYGSNGNGIFFFTTAGTYVEWNGEYMLADSPLQLATPPELTMTVK